MIETKVTKFDEDDYAHTICSADIDVKPPTGAKEFAEYVAAEYTRISQRRIATRDVTGFYSRDCADHSWNSIRNPHGFNVEFMLYCDGEAWATIVGKREPTNNYSLRNMYPEKGDFKLLLQMLDPDWASARRA